MSIFETKDPPFDPNWPDDDGYELYLGYEEGHKCCPDCGDDPNDHTLHREGCPRIGTPLQDEATWH